MWNFKTTLNTNNLNTSSNRPTEIKTALRLLMLTATNLLMDMSVVKRIAEYSVG